MIPIVFAADHNFVMPTCVAIASLLSTKKSGVEYDINIIIDDDLTENDRKILEKQVADISSGSSLHFIEIGKTFDNGFEIREISKACYNRLMIPWLMNYDKVIYSDGDIIFNGDISDIYRIDLGEKLVAGYGGNVWKKGIIKKYLKKIGADPNEYINSGFLLINSRLQREQNLKPKYLELAKRKFIYQDQDIINLVCKGKIGKLPAEYNVKPIDVSKFPEGSVKVIHYIGLKPWDYFTYSWNEWWSVYRRSVIFDPTFNQKISQRILSSKYRKKINRKVIKQKINFLKNYLFFKN